jgi:hypothetical protein
MTAGFDPLYLSFPSAYTAKYSSGRLEIPVLKSQVLYANFEHVTGVAASGTGGISINKLKILDVLIDRLASIKKNPDQSFRKSGVLSEDRIDALISQYEKELHLSAAQAPKPYVSPVSIEPGSLISLSA